MFNVPKSALIIRKNEPNAFALVKSAFSLPDNASSTSLREPNCPTESNTNNILGNVLPAFFCSFNLSNNCVIDIFKSSMTLLLNNMNLLGDISIPYPGNWSNSMENSVSTYITE